MAHSSYSIYRVRYFIRVNRSKVFIDKDDFHHDDGSSKLKYMKIEHGCSSEQCAGCGSDIAHTGYFADHATVVCDECGEAYLIQTC